VTSRPSDSESSGGVVGSLVPPPPQTGAQFPVLDTLRAVGALCVLTTHTAFWAGTYTGHGTWGTLLARLDVGVAVFFVLSGFLLSRPWLEGALAQRERPGAAGYFWKRALRILPLYVATVMVAYAFIADNRDLGARRFLSTLLLLDPYWRENFPDGLTQMWSLSAEVAFYLVLPLLMLVLVGRRRALSPRRVLLGLAALAAASVYWHLSGAAVAGRGNHAATLQWLPAYLTWFGSGILLALSELLWRQGGRARVNAALVSLGRQPGSCWAIVAGLALVSATPLAGPSMLAAPSPAQSLVKSLLYAGIGFLIVLTGVHNDPQGRYTALFSNPWGRRLGWISYGIFCLHLPVLHFVMWATGWELFAGHAAQIWVLTVALSIAVAELGYRTVERPALRLKRLRRPTIRRPGRPETATQPSTPSSGTSIT
jgi:peptidoglycan/LPS O-acetylase OafA/YrhL